MEINLIAAADLQNGIGKDGKLLYHIKEDLQYFKKQTLNNIVIMGRKTLESLPNGRALNNRINIVITRDKDFKCSTAIVVNSIEESIKAINFFDDVNSDLKAFVIGGASIYKQFMQYADNIYLTKIYDVKQADSHFPEMLNTDWKLLEYNKQTTHEELDYAFLIYTRQTNILLK